MTRPTSKRIPVLLLDHPMSYRNDVVLDPTLLSIVPNEIIMRFTKILQDGLHHLSLGLPIPMMLYHGKYGKIHTRSLYASRKLVDDIYARRQLHLRSPVFCWASEGLSATGAYSRRLPKTLMDSSAL